MTVRKTTIEDLEDRCKRYEQRESLLVDELRVVREKVAHYRATLADLAMDDLASEASGIHAHIRASDITHCKSHIEAWTEIARRSGGLVRPSEAAQLLIDAGVSKGLKKSVVSSAWNLLGSRDDWEQLGGGSFQWLLFESPDVADVDAANDGDELWPDEPSPTDDGEESPHSSQESPVTPGVLGRITV